MGTVDLAGSPLDPTGFGLTGQLLALAGLAVTAGLLPADDRAGFWTVGLLATAFYGTGLLGYYPWPFRDQGRRWVRALVLAVGVVTVIMFRAAKRLVFYAGEDR